MNHQEKKYRVQSFDSVLKKLAKLGAVKAAESVTTHYYADIPGNDVVKLVQYSDRCEIHKLHDEGGTFTLTEQLGVAGLEAGLAWLKDQGFTAVQAVKMANTEYRYEQGVVGLYTINDDLLSVIVDFPGAQHAHMEAALGLADRELITVPFNKLLTEDGSLKSTKLD